MKRAEYPFSRHERSPYEYRPPDWEKYYCRICGSSDYAHPDSAAYRDGRCVDCSINEVTGTAPSDCEEHGSYLAWVTKHGLHGECSDCAAERTTAEKTKGTCFVVTVCTAPDSWEVEIFRRFRDTHLVYYRTGRRMIEFYQVHGAKLAVWLDPHTTVRGGLRTLLLRPLAHLIAWLQLKFAE